MSIVLLILSIAVIALCISLLTKEKYIAPAGGYIPDLDQTFINTFKAALRERYDNKELDDQIFEGGVNPEGSIDDFNSVPDLDFASRFGTLAATNTTMGMAADRNFL